MPGEFEQLQRVRVFCASPGDVRSERRAVERVVHELDGIWSDRGVALEFDGWEDLGPAAGRPQELINELVDACHIFVGLLDARWGTPTGTYESGFEEEYLRAYDRFRRDGEPELCIFFTSRPRRGSQLALVQGFRERLRGAEEVFYRDFDGIGDLERILRRRLEKYLDRLGEPPEPGPTPYLIVVRGRAVHFVAPPGWEAQDRSEIEDIQTLEPPDAKIHVAMYRRNAPNDGIYSMRVGSILGSANDHLHQTPPEQWPILVEQATGLRLTSPVSRVEFAGGVGYRWTLDGIMDGSRLARPHQSRIALHSMEMWAPFDDDHGVLKFLCIAPPGSAAEAAEDFDAMISSWRW